MPNDAYRTRLLARGAQNPTVNAVVDTVLRNVAARGLEPTKPVVYETALLSGLRRCGARAVVDLVAMRGRTA